MTEFENIVIGKSSITKTGYVVMLFSSVFGLLIFLIGRYFYGKSLKKKQTDNFQIHDMFP